jgi:asparagine synthase (glutamine-hydrolysing)
MCGIAGFINFSRNLTRGDLAGCATRMANTLRHRGPDDSGVWTDETAGVALAHRRLAILDLSAAGHQPMVSACDRYVISFNGEIYNFESLRKELDHLGHKFRSSSDTEVVLAAVSQWGLDAAVRRFNGMFAFALWDQSERVVHLARDRAGEKPLYYAFAGSTFLFGSELKALVAYPPFSPVIDRSALCLYMRYGYIPAPYSIYEGVRKLPPASIISVSSAAESTLRTFWSSKKIAEVGTYSQIHGDEVSATEELHRLLSDAVKIRMVADVPLGAFLSGGIDSAAIVALMQAQSPGPVRTFTIGFGDPLYNEAGRARRIARHLGTEHSELYVGPQQALEVVPRLPALYDEPFSDPSQIPTFIVSQFARQSVTVSLSGDAGDELFGGYNTYKHSQSIWRNTSRVPMSWRRRATRPGSALHGICSRRLAGLLGPRYGRALTRLEHLSSILTADCLEDVHRRLISRCQRPDGAGPGETPEPSTPFTEPSSWARMPSMIQRLMYLDFITYLPGDILVKLDRASMGVSLEARIPLLDHRVIEFSWRLQESLLVRGRESKWILRQVLHRYVPRQLMKGPKVGFAVPISAWLRGPLRDWTEDLLDERRLRQNGYVDASETRRLLDQHLSGVRDRAVPLWDLLMFEAWFRESMKPVQAAA